MASSPLSVDRPPRLSISRCRGRHDFPRAHRSFHLTRSSLSRSTSSTRVAACPAGKSTGGATWAHLRSLPTSPPIPPSPSTSPPPSIPICSLVSPARAQVFASPRHRPSSGEFLRPRGRRRVLSLRENYFKKMRTCSGQLRRSTSPFHPSPHAVISRAFRVGKSRSIP